MKFIVVVAFTTLLAVGQSAKLNLKDNARQPRIYEPNIKNLLSCVENIARTGLPDLGLPVLDPLVIDDKVINLGLINSSLADGTLHIQNGQAKGLAGWRFDSLKVRLVILPPSVNVDFNLVNDEIDVSGDYDLDATILGNPYSGKGSVSLVLGKLSLEGHIKEARVSLKDITNLNVTYVKNLDVIVTIGNVNVSAHSSEGSVSLFLGKLSLKGHIQEAHFPITNITNLDVGLTVSDVNFKITGVNNEEELSQNITNKIIYYLNNFLVENKDHINQIIKDLINTTLGKNEHATNINAIIQKIRARCLPSKK